MNMIVVVDKNWAIGKDNGLLVHLPGDLKHFKEKTLGKTVVMGRKTLESMPGGRPLPGRTNILLSSKAGMDSGCKVCRSAEELENELKNHRDEDVFIIGGESVYCRFYSRCHTLYVTKIFAEFEADKHFPNLDEMEEFRVSKQSPMMEEKGIKYQFVEYRKR